MSCLLHESLSSFSKLFLGTENLILVSSLNEGNDIFSVDLNIASIDELEEALQYFRLDVRDRDLSLGPLHKWSIEHLLKDIGASREYLAVCKYSLGTRMLSRNNDNICKSSLNIIFFKFLATILELSTLYLNWEVSKLRVYWVIWSYLHQSIGRPLILRSFLLHLLVGNLSR